MGKGCNLYVKDRCVATCWIYRDKRCCIKCNETDKCKKVCGFVRKDRVKINEM